MVSALILRLVPRLIIHWFLAFQLSYVRYCVLMVFERLTAKSEKKDMTDFDLLLSIL